MTVTLAEERFDQYRLCAECSCNIGEARQLVDDTFSMWRKFIIPRDRVALTLGYDGESLSFNELSDSKLQDVHELLSLSDDEDNARFFLELIVHKNVIDQRISLYEPKLFGNYLATTPILQVLTVLSVRFDNKLVFESASPIERGGSSSISFQSVGISDDNSNGEDGKRIRRSMFEVFKDNSFSRSLPGSFIPHDFNFVKEIGVPDVDLFFKKARTLVSAIYLVNSAELDEANILEYRLCGYRNVTGVTSLDGLADASDLMYKIVDWAYTGGGSSDKIGLARNVLSLYISGLDELSQHSEVFNAINSNYQIYLKENVESYLEVKGKITDVLVDAVKKTHDLVDSFVDSLKNGIFVLLTFVLTVVVVNGLKDTSASAIFSMTYIWVVVVLSVLMSVWVFGARVSSLRQFDKAYESIEQLLKRNYLGVIAEAEIDSALNPIRISNRDYLSRLSAYYARVWLLIVSLLITGFVGGNLYLESGKASVVVQNEPPSTQAIGPPVNLESKPVSVTVSPNPLTDPVLDSALNRRVDMRKNTAP
ncbi:hypothetical protein JFV30_29865 [Pseudomonas sp. TH32]|uniref:hypothetical protein n=1 Tax=Pseudomonas sp. TH32 TaxID=2796397 RepID=UPI0019132428|nr:hypothetical protein [Pseudomonas sp. TH32]MBK5440894.1 hypothetical protein [Pseudomonas sp. TH32]